MLAALILLLQESYDGPLFDTHGHPRSEVLSIEKIQELYRANGIPGARVTRRVDDRERCGKEGLGHEDPCGDKKYVEDLLAFLKENLQAAAGRGASARVRAFAPPQQRARPS